MRVNAEKQRITQYKQVARESAIFYYRVLKRFSEENQRHEREKMNNDKGVTDDPMEKIKTLNKENILRDILSYVTGRITSA